MQTVSPATRLTADQHEVNAFGRLLTADGRDTAKSIEDLLFTVAASHDTRLRPETVHALLTLRAKIVSAMDAVRHDLSLPKP